ncbi:phosphatase PAP2 family protein [Candidatus Woesearchaeota archaeon]|nr:phosphatase PAP2 family protein [Candidatus Woesearchaeota archaeon]
MGKKYFLWLIFLAAFIVSVFFDKEIFFFVTNHRVSFLNALMVMATDIIAIIVVFLAATIILFLGAKKKQWVIPLLFSLAASEIIVFVMKYLVGRIRPDVIFGVAALVQEASPSFPSAHAAAIFAALPVLNKEYPKLKILWIAISLLIAYSRIYVGVHYLSDVIAGAMIGYAIGKLIIYLKNSNLFKKINIIIN